MNRSHIAVGLLAAALLAGLTACVSVESDRQPQIRTSPSASASLPEVFPTEEDADRYAALLVELSWSEQTEEDRQAMCDSIELLGTDWAAGVLREGESVYGPDSGGVDWNAAAQLIADKCVAGGYT